MRGVLAMTEPDVLIVAVRTVTVNTHLLGDSEHKHIAAVQLADDSMVNAADAIRQIQEHEVHYVMIPPPGAPARAAFEETMLPLLVQTRLCPQCGEEVLYA